LEIKAPLIAVYLRPQMEHFFELPINYQDEDRLLKARLVTFAYAYKYFIIIDGKELIVERDDEQTYRVVLSDPNVHLSIDPELIEIIINQLQKLNP